MNRRDFLKGAGAAIVPAALPGALWTPAAGSEKPQSAEDVPADGSPVTAVVFDERYPDCREFAEALALRGAKPFATNQDAAQLWYGGLRAHLAQNPGRVAGLTTYADFSVSLACGRELGLARLYEGAHDGRRSRAELAHRASTRSGAAEIAVAFAGISWAARLADALSRLHAPAVEGGNSEFRLLTAITQRSAGHPGYLNSWLLS